MGKDKMSNSKFVLGIAALFVFAALGMAYIFGGADKPTQVVVAPASITGNTDQPATFAGTNVCTGGRTQSFDRDHYDRDNVNTAFTDPELFRKAGDTKWTAGTEGTALTTLNEGNNYEFISGISLTDFVDESYGPYTTYTNLPCVDRIDVESADNEPETTLTATWYNEADNAAGQTMVANTDYEVEVRLRASSENYFGNPYLDSYKALGFTDKGSHRIDFPNVLTLHLNVTGMDIPDYVKATGTTGKLTFNSATNKWEEGKQVLSAEPMNKIACPDRANTEHGSATSTHYCYELPVIGDNEIVLTLGFDTDNTIAPVVDDTGYMYAANVFVDDNGVLDWGVETDMGADVANDDADSVTLDYTA